MSILKKSLSVLIQLLLVLCFMVSTGEAANRTLRNTAVNIDTFAKVDDATSALTGLNSFTVDGVERAFQQWFWYRLGPAGSEASLDKLPKKIATTQPTPSSLLITYTLASQFDISVLYELTPYMSGAGKANLKKTITIINTAATDLDFHFFEYSDFDISDTGASAGDTDNLEVFNNKVYQNGPQISGAGVSLVHDASLPPSKFDIDTNSTYIKPELLDAAPTDLSSPQTPYRYGDDMQFGQQWDLTIPVGQSVSFSITDSFYPTFPVAASKTHAGTCVTYHGQANYTIGFDNLANTEGLTNLNIIDFLPKNTTPATPPTNGGVYDPNTNTVTWSLPALVAGAVQQTEQLSITVDSSTDITNELLLVSDQAFPTRITDQATLCNHPPAMNNISNASINEGGAFSLQVVALDPDKDPLVYALSGAPAGMTISTAGLISYPAGVAGTYVITVTATDSGSLSASKIFTLTVVKVNKPPVITSIPPTATNDYQLYTYNITATDPDGDTLSYGLTKAPLGMSIAGSVVSWTPTKEQAGVQAIQAMVSDGQGHYVYQDFNITVAHVNHPPIINTSTLPPATATVATFYNYPVVASDPDGDSLTYSLTVNPAGMTIGTTGVIGWTPAADQNNKVHAVTVQVSDGLGGVATYSFNITVGTAGKQTPVITWANPAAITYLTPLSNTQLNATASVPGTFVYTPAAGTILNAGVQTLSAAFTPTDLVTYNTASKSVSLTVNKSVAAITLSNLNHTYNGSAKSATVVTNPGGLNYSSTYNGSITAPTVVGTYTVVVTINDADFTGSATGTLVIAKATPTITWATPAAIYLGTALSATQLNATASVAGSFVYTPASGTVMNTAGSQTLSVAFTPTDTTNYNNASATVSITVNNKQTPVITWATPAAISYGTTLSATQLNATASVAGTFTYTPAAGTVLSAGAQTLSVTFTPNDTATYNSATKTVTLTVNKAAATVTLTGLSATYDGTAKSATATTTPAGLAVAITYGGSATAPTAAGTYAVAATITDVNYTGSATGTLVIAKATPTITWATPAPIYLGTALSATQLNATASVQGSFVYTPASGTVMNTAGSQTLSVAFTPTDTTNYNNASATVSITVNNKQTPVITWANPAAITYGTALTTTQLNATASVPGTFAYTPASGAVLSAGAQTLSVVFTPTDTVTYNTATKSVSLTVNKATPTITWATPAAIYLGTALSSTQLNATASVPGSFVYTPAAGTVMNTAGAQTLSVAFTPTDATNYSNASATVSITVNNKQTPTITWVNPAAITYGTALTATQLNATASVAGSFTYTPAAGTVLSAGTQTLSVTFTPNDTATYNSATKTVSLTVNKAAATVTLTGLSATYDGTAKSATATTTPAGLAVAITYGGSATAPTAAGSYAVAATITDVNYTGSATGTLVIAKATPTITWATPAPIYLGTALSATQLNATANVPGSFAYIPASGTVMNTAGNVSLTVVFTPTDTANYNTANGGVTLVVNNKTNQTIDAITFNPATLTVGGTTTASATATSGLAVTFSSTSPTVCTVSGSTVTAIAAGTCTIAANQAGNATYNAAPQVTGSITVAKAAATVTLAGLTATYDGTAKAVTATTNPAGLAVTITYGGSATVPTAAGNYAVVATINDTNYTGSANGGLIINKATPTITWPTPTPVVVGTALSATQLNATVSGGTAGTFAYTPASGTIMNTAGNQTLTVAFTPTDAANYNTANGSVTMTVNPVSVLPPTMSSIPAATVNSGSAFSYQVAASDPQGQSLSYKLAGNPVGMSISTTGLISWAKTVTGTYNVTVTATNTSNLSASQPLALTVNNQAPTMTAIPAATITVPAAFSYQVVATDPNGDALVYSLAGNPAGMSISNTGLISWTPSVAGTYTITATATDTGTLKASQSFTLTVNGGIVKQPPAITSTPVTNGYRDGYYYYQVVASDPNGDALSYSLTTKPSGMTINSSTGLIYWHPGDDGTYSVTVKVTDASGLSASQSFKLNIVDRPSNSSPRITSLPVTSAKVGVLYNYDVNATDSNGDTPYYRLTTAPSGMVIDLVSGIISWTPTSSQTGSRSVTIEAVDSKGGKSSQSYTIQVIDGSNNPPVITSSPVTTAFVGKSYSYQVVASDPEGKSLTYSLVTKPSSYMQISSTGLITWTPSSYSLGNKTVTVRVSDGTRYTDQTYILSVKSSSTAAATPLTIQALSVNNVLPAVLLNSRSN